MATADAHIDSTVHGIHHFRQNNTVANVNVNEKREGFLRK